jgi:type IV pilus assembly protein PilM
MARRLIGLDVGTNAVTIAEVSPGSPPRLDMFAQVALPREAMREGEIADEAAVSDAVTRLRSEVGLKKVAVRVGIASPRVVVRQVEMPVMTREELASALEFQAADLIPISIDDAVLDFAILGQSVAAPTEDGGGGEPTMQVLLAAAQEATIARLVSSVEAGGLQVAAVDLIPLALTRALARPVPAMAPVAGDGGVALADGVGAEGIVSFGGGVTSIAVHEGGVPRFVRVLGSGGRELTDAIAHDVDVPAETAEALKRALATPGDDAMVARARAAVDRPLSVLLDEVRSSVDYYRNQPNAARLQRVIVTGGSAQLPGLPERLAALVGVPVEPAYMHDLIRVGNIGFAPDELPRLEPYLPAAVGLALGGAAVGTVINLQPKRRHSVGTRVGSRLNPKIAIAAAAAVVVLGGLTYVEHSKASDAKSKQAAAETQETKLKNQINHLVQSQSQQGGAGNLSQQAATLLGADVGWTRMLGDVGSALPPGVWITSFQGTHTLGPAKGAGAAPTAGGGTTGGAAAQTAQTAPNGANNASNAAAASGGANPAGANVSGAAGGVVAAPLGAASCAGYEAPITGTIAISGIARDVNSLSAFIDALASAGDAKNPDVVTVWLSGAQKAKFGDADVITFSLNAMLAPGARSDRLTTFFKEAVCK